MMLTRRSFIKSTGSLLVYFSLSPNRHAMAAGVPVRLPGDLKKNPELDSWLRIDKEGTVTVFSGKAEIGQGVLTALGQIAAEELDVNFSRISIKQVDTAHSPDEGVTSGSVSIERAGAALRIAAAEARQIMLDLASEQLKVSADKLNVRDGVFVINDKPVALDYWQILAGKEFKTAVYGRGKPKDHQLHRLVGTSVPRLDIPDKVFGEEIYLYDLRLPGMLHARVVRPPSPGSKLLQVAADSIEGSKGIVKVVRDGSFLAVVAEREEQAVHAAEKLKSKCRWSRGISLPDQNRITDWLKSSVKDVKVIAEKGDSGSVNHKKKFFSQYTRPYQAHASLSPSIGVAKMDKGVLTVWSHAQGMYPLRGAIAKTLGLQQAKVRCIHVQGSGCYGHNGADDAALDAALVAMSMPGKAIRLQYSRDDEFRWEPYGSAMVMEVQATLDENGFIDDWVFDVFSCPHSTRPRGARGAGNLFSAGLIEKNIPKPAPVSIPRPRGGGDRNAVPLYQFPSMRVTKHFVTQMPLRVSALRTLGAYANVFAIESFMDELALSAEIDPVDFRIKHLKDQRAIAVLEKLKQISGWSSFKKQPGKGRGIGFARYKNLSAYNAVVFFVEVNRDDGNIRLEKAVAVTDAGQVINPDGLNNQIEGGIIQAASWTLKEQLHFSNEQVTSLDWVSYPILKFSEVPEVESRLIDRPDEPPLGVGEASQGPAAAALANAVADATGIRLREIPYTHDRVRHALNTRS